MLPVSNSPTRDEVVPLLEAHKVATVALGANSNAHN
jgi:hypothetical protein